MSNQLAYEFPHVWALANRPIHEVFYMPIRNRKGFAWDMLMHTDGMTERLEWALLQYVEQVVSGDWVSIMTAQDNLRLVLLRG